ncbi:LysR family transcriptional regulator, partial [Klebsiella pneumoniae]|uniref:helix-turn-helix domain-containing protein n=1 Tax=Klebsiella pneumoniae TaxID=573 RepID=UPI0028C4B79A
MKERVSSFSPASVVDVIALEESRSFTLAAKARNISQSSFSRRIQSLDNHMGFLRHRERVHSPLRRLHSDCQAVS